MPKFVVMPYSDYRSEHRRLMGVLKKAGAKQELRKQKAEHPMIVMAPTMRKLMSR